jgi:IS5 family transposase
MKTDGRLDRNPLKGARGDALHVVLCGAGHNIRLLMKRLRLLWPEIVKWLSAEWAGNKARLLMFRA